MSEEGGLSRLESAQPVILIAAMFLGLLVGSLVSSFTSISNSVVYFTLIGLMYGIALGTPLKRVFRSFSRIRFFAIAWSLNFIFIPLLGYVLASIFFGGSPLIFVGFILYIVTPCTDWFLVFTSMAKGDVSLGLALLPTNLILQILLIPVYLWLFAGQIVPFQLSALVGTVLIFIVLPFVLAILTSRAVIRFKGQEWKEQKLDKTPIYIQTATLAIVIFFMFAGQTHVILQNAGPLSIVLVPVLIFFIISYLVSQSVSKALKLKYGERALLTCTTIARNSPLALAIAFGLFPDQPLTQVAIIIGVLIELPALVLIVRLLRRSMGASPKTRPIEEIKDTVQ